MNPPGVFDNLIQMIRLMLILTGLALLLVPAAATAREPAQVTSCKFQSSLVPGSGPASGYKDLRIQITASKVDDYMPKCGVATFVASSADGRKRIKIMGASWYVGAYTCSYRYMPVKGRDEIDVFTKCIHLGSYANTVWFETSA